MELLAGHTLLHRGIGGWLAALFNRAVPSPLRQVLSRQSGEVDVSGIQSGCSERLLS